MARAGSAAFFRRHHLTAERTAGTIVIEGTEHLDVMPRSQTIRFATLTDRGRVRGHNEDACAADADLGLFVVCDGMGGHAGGEVAATETAVGIIARAQYLQQVADPAERMAEVIRAMNRSVFDLASREPRLRGMGTTVVALEVSEDGGSVCIAHAGDSRCYRLRTTGLERLTADHSFVEEQVRSGLLTEEAARRSHLRNVITRVVGTRQTLEPEIASFDAAPGDLYLLCSDGLNRDLADSDLLGILCRHRHHLPQAARVLVDAANLLGGGDNITVVLVEIPGDEAHP